MAFLPEPAPSRSDLFAGARLLAWLAVSNATVCGAAAGPGKAPLEAVCLIMAAGLVFGAMLFVLVWRMSPAPLRGLVEDDEAALPEPTEAGTSPLPRIPPARVPASQRRAKGSRRVSGPARPPAPGADDAAGEAARRAQRAAAASGG